MIQNIITLVLDSTVMYSFGSNLGSSMIRSYIDSHFSVFENVNLRMGNKINLHEFNNVHGEYCNVFTKNLSSEGVDYIYKMMCKSPNFIELNLDLLPESVYDIKQHFSNEDILITYNNEMLISGQGNLLKIDNSVNDGFMDDSNIKPSCYCNEAMSGCNIL